MILRFWQGLKLSFGVYGFCWRWGWKAIFLLLLLFLILLFPEWLLGFLLLRLLLGDLLSKHGKRVWFFERCYCLLWQTLKVSTFLVRVVLIIHVWVFTLFNFVIYCLFLRFSRWWFSFLKSILFLDFCFFLNTLFWIIDGYNLFLFLNLDRLWNISNKLLDLLRSNECLEIVLMLLDDFVDNFLNFKIFQGVELYILVVFSELNIVVISFARTWYHVFKDDHPISYFNS